MEIPNILYGIVVQGFKAWVFSFEESDSMFQMYILFQTYQI